MVAGLPEKSRLISVLPFSRTRIPLLRLPWIILPSIPDNPIALTPSF